MELLASLKKNTLGISIFAVVTAGLIAITQVMTADQISDNKRNEESRALHEIVPEGSTDTDLVSSKLVIEAPELGYQQATVYQAIKDGEVNTVILPVITPEGYSGDIALIVGINADSTVEGVRVLAHQETPGLGDKIDLKKSDWIKTFNGKTLDGPVDSNWAVKKDGGEFDQFTGATITPRAVVGAVGMAIRFFDLHKEELLTPVSKAQTPEEAQ